MISYLILSTSLFVVSPALIQDEQRQRQLETKFNSILAKNGVKDVNEIIQRALLRYYTESGVKRTSAAVKLNYAIRCEDIIAGCISPGVYADSVDCCAKFFPSGSFVSTTGACVTTLSSPPMFQVFHELNRLMNLFKF